MADVAVRRAPVGSEVGRGRRERTVGIVLRMIPGVGPAQAKSTAPLKPGAGGRVCPEAREVQGQRAFERVRPGFSVRHRADDVGKPRIGPNAIDRRVQVLTDVLADRP